MANTYINISQELSPQDLIYINTKKTLQADIINVPNTVIFTGATILEPTSLLPPTSIADFDLYINGQNVSSLIASFNNYVGGVSVTFDTAQLGYELETDDQVIAIGKFV